MKIQFTEKTISPDYSFEKDEIIDSNHPVAKLNPNWLSRGVVVEFKEPAPVVRTATVKADPEVKKAVKQ